ncbi:MAG: DNA-binding response regulator [Pseudomonadota bacterium]|nr:DNA-binding response regulator [Pseudomonadota bacterium]
MDRTNIALVVDDDPATLDLVVAALEECGMTVLAARDGATALGLVGRVRPDVILLDAMMPRLDGFETCRRLKASPHGAEAPVIFMTGLADPEHIVQGLECGAVDYITKPLQVEELIARMTIHIMNSKLIRSARAALDVSGPALLACSVDGRLLWGSPRAMELTGDEGILPAGLAEWLGGAANRPLSELSVRTFGDHEFSIIGFGASGEILVKIAPAPRASKEERLAAAFGLTQREGEVLYWLSLGKANRDIADILKLSTRTVNKHLEQVFQKMGVDNRTSAAVKADRLIQSE